MQGSVGFTCMHSVGCGLVWEGGLGLEACRPGAYRKEQNRVYDISGINYKVFRDIQRSSAVKSRIERHQSSAPSNTTPRRLRVSCKKSDLHLFEPLHAEPSQLYSRYPKMCPPNPCQNIGRETQSSKTQHQLGLFPTNQDSPANSCDPANNV